VTAVVTATVGVLVGFIIVAVPVVTTQASTLAEEMPHYLHTLNHQNSLLAKLNHKYHFVNGLQKLLSGSGSFNSAVGLGKALLGFVSSVVLVVVVTIYMLADMPRVKRGLYLLAPKSRRHCSASSARSSRYRWLQLSSCCTKR
jgi:predicted PurR-regulated permease PerM